MFQKIKSWIGEHFEISWTKMGLAILFNFDDKQFAIILGPIFFLISWS